MRVGVGGALKGIVKAMGKLRSLAAYVVSSRSRYRIHSRFVYDFVEFIRKKEELPAQYALIEAWRKQCKENKTVIEVVDYGARGMGRHRFLRISSVVKSSISKTKGKILYRTSLFVNAKDIFELGTCLGISTGYLALSGANVITVEGAPQLASLASSFLKSCSMNNVSVINDRFENVIERYMREGKKFDLIFLDGDHVFYKLPYYILSLCELLREDGVLIIDDIRYERKMHKVWKEVSRDAPPLLVIEFFNMGFLFNTERMQKEHYVIWSSKFI